MPSPSSRTEAIVGTVDAPVVTLTRLGGSTHDVVGIFAIAGDPVAVTLELAWNNNKRAASCIPLGVYWCERVQSAQHGDTFAVTGVPGRSGILFHVGNKAADSLGCVLLGAAFGPPRPDGARTVIGSRIARERFRRELAGVAGFWLRVTTLPDVPALIAQVATSRFG